MIALMDLGLHSGIATNDPEAIGDLPWKGSWKRRCTDTSLPDCAMAIRCLEPDARDRALARIELARALIGKQDSLGALLAWEISEER